MQTRATAVPLDLQEQLITIGSRLSRYMIAEFEGERAMDSLTIDQFCLLHALCNGAMSMSDNPPIGITRAGAAGLVSRLVERTLVTPAEQPSNRRQIMVSLTPEGNRIQQGGHERALREAEGLLSRLADDDVQALAHAFDSLGAVLDEAARS